MEEGGAAFLLLGPQLLAAFVLTQADQIPDGLASFHCCQGCRAVVVVGKEEGKEGVAGLEGCAWLLRGRHVHLSHTHKGKESWDAGV